MPAANKLFVFISRASGSDISKDWGPKFKAWLEQDGHEVLLQEKDFKNNDFVMTMDAGLRKASQPNGRILALYSPQYLASDNCMKEATHLLGSDLGNTKNQLIPLLVEDCAPNGMLKNIIYFDLRALLTQGDAGEVKHALEVVLGLRADEPLMTRLRCDAPKVMHPSIRQITNFVGREEVFAQISTHCADQTSVAPTAMVGMGGVGKSAAALEYAVRKQADYAAIWVIQAEVKTTLEQDLSIFARELAPRPKIQNAQDELRQSLHTLNAYTADKPLLVIFDNATNPPALKPYLPNSAGVHCLITSRYPKWSHVGQGVETIALDVLHEDDAVKLLLEITQSSDHQGAADLALRLGYLPLALKIAGHLILEYGRFSFADYMAKLDTLLHETLPEEDGFDYPLDVIKTLKLSLEQLKSNDEAAFERMAIFAWLAPAPIPHDILDFEPDSEQLTNNKRLQAMQRSACLERTELPDTSLGVEMHRLMAAAMRHYRGPQNQERDIGRALDLVARGARAAGGQYDITNAKAFERYLPHAAALAGLTVINIESHPGYKALLSILNRLGAYHDTRADYKSAEIYVRQCLRVAETHYGANHPEVATGLNNLAGLLLATNRLEEAEPLYRGALAIDEASFGPDHPNVATDLNNLAGLLRDTNRLEEAAPLFRRALATNEASFGADHPKVATALNNLASLLSDTNCLEEAEPLYQRALAIDEASFGPDHPNVAIRLHNLAGLLADTGRAMMALPLAERATKIYMDSFGPDHPDTQKITNSRENIAMSAFLQSLTPEALGAFNAIATLPEAEQGAAFAAFIAEHKDLSVISSWPKEG